jgi:hypothetical protein
VSRFYVTDSRLAGRARQAIRDHKPASMPGTIGSKTRTFHGMVRSVEEDTSASPRRWLITIIDAK